MWPAFLRDIMDRIKQQQPLHIIELLDDRFGERLFRGHTVGKDGAPQFGGVSRINPFADNSVRQ